MKAALLGALLLAAACGRDATPARRPVVTEERDGLWLTSGESAPRRVTALRVPGFDYGELAAKQREGAVILYWAAAPVLSPAADRIAYATNREAVAAGTNGQSIWLLDLSDGSERALLHRDRRSFRPVGWLGEEVVFIGDEPGVWALDMRGATRLLSEGTMVAAADDGEAIAVAHGVPGRVTLHVITRAETIDVPPPPAGFEYLMQGRFGNDGILHLELAADSGRVRRPIAYDVAARRLRDTVAP